MIVPAALPVDAHAGFVGLDHLRTAQASEDRGDLGIDAHLVAAEARVQRAFADRKPEQVEEQPR